MQNKKTIFIVGGHFTPAQAIVEEFINDKNYNLYYVGVKHTILFDKNFSNEYIFTKKYNIKFLSLNTGKIYRFISIKGLISLLKIPLGFIQSIYYIIKYNPDLIMTFGSYVSVPIVICAKIFNKKIFTHIQTPRLGLSDKVSSKYANKIFISWTETQKYLDKSKDIIYTGNIVRKEIFQKNSNTIKFESNDTILYITGGGQGSSIINNFIFKIIKDLIKKYNIIHQTGKKDYQESLNIKKSLDRDVQNKYLTFDNINENTIGEVFSKSEIIIGRSGANTVYEILLLNKKAILVPLEIGAKDDQKYNALIAKNTSNKILIIEEKNLNFEDLTTDIEQLLSIKDDVNIDIPKDANIRISNSIKSYLDWDK
jgi:UDP-N-acetylglucosamine--N-acetylmuramyl-(pentapeptide) pyrophosphoryl-undecaprenol N-acetylglucosamine transferase